MIQELLAKTLDNISYFYMGTQKRVKQGPFYAGDIEEYLAREKAADPMEFFRNSGQVPDVEITETQKRNRYDIHKFKFESFIETPHFENNTVYGRLYEQHGKPDAPTVVVLHGWRMESYIFFDKFCRQFIKEGFNAVLVDLPYHMNRRADNSFHGEFTFTDDAVFTLEVMRQSLTDIFSVMNWIRSRGTEQIGMFGVSYGGLLTGVSACVEPTLDFAMLLVPPADMAEVFAKSRLGRLFERENPNARKMLARYRMILDNISLVKLKPLVPKERIFIVEGRYDGMVPQHVIEQLWRAWGKPTIKRYHHGHLSVLILNPQLDRDMHVWLKALKASGPYIRKASPEAPPEAKPAKKKKAAAKRAKG